MKGFAKAAKAAARFTGQPLCFGIAGGLIVVWALSGPLFGFSDTWQLIVNTGTTIVTFLMVFLIQNTQNRDTEAMQLKLDELIRSTTAAHNALMDLEELDEEALERFRKQYGQIAKRVRARDGDDDGAPEDKTGDARPT